MSGTAESLPWYLRPPQTRRLLVLAEDARLRDTLLRGLTRLEFEVIALPSDELDTVLQSKPDRDFHAVVLDVASGQTALMATRLRRLRDGGLTVPILCLASANDRNAVVSQTTLGPLAAVIKPIDIQEVGSEASRIIHQAEDAGR